VRWFLTDWKERTYNVFDDCAVLSVVLKWLIPDLEPTPASRVALERDHVHEVERVGFVKTFFVAE
jgi:hypothetical protein